MPMPCPGAPQGLGDPETVGAQGERQRRLWGSSWAKAVSINVFSGGGCSLWSLSSGVRWAPERPQRASRGSGVLVKVSVSGGAAELRGTGALVLLAQRRLELLRGIRGTAGPARSPRTERGYARAAGAGRARGGSIQQRINSSPLSVDQFHLKCA